MKYTLIFIGILLSSIIGTAQPTLSKKEHQERYERNIKKERLYGVYIPKDMEDAFVELTALARPEDLAKFKAAPEDTIAVRLHFGLGRWISHNWSFNEGSRFSHQFKLKGLTFPDDMVETVIRSFHRKLNNKEIMLDEQVAILVKKREEEHAERMKKAKVETLSKRKLGTEEIEALKKQKE